VKNTNKKIHKEKRIQKKTTARYTDYSAKWDGKVGEEFYGQEQCCSDQQEYHQTTLTQKKKEMT
jgi:hypothetical protein